MEVTQEGHETNLFFLNTIEKNTLKLGKRQTLGHIYNK